MQKNRFKKHQIFEKWDFFQNRPSCKGYSPCKILTLGQKLKFKKHVKIHSTNYLEFFCAKNRSKKHQIFEKWDHFQNRPSCKGYSPCKMLILGQKLKFKKHVKIHSTNYLEFFCAKIPFKKHQIFEKWDHFQNPPSCKGYSPCKLLTLGQKL